MTSSATAWTTWSLSTTARHTPNNKHSSLSISKQRNRVPISWHCEIIYYCLIGVQPSWWWMEQVHNNCNRLIWIKQLAPPSPAPPPQPAVVFNDVKNVAYYHCFQLADKRLPLVVCLSVSIDRRPYLIYLDSIWQIILPIACIDLFIRTWNCACFEFKSRVVEDYNGQVGFLPSWLPWLWTQTKLNILSFGGTFENNLRYLHEEDSTQTSVSSYQFYSQFFRFQLQLQFRFQSQLQPPLQLQLQVTITSRSI